MSTLVDYSRPPTPAFTSNARLVYPPTPPHSMYPAHPLPYSAYPAVPIPNVHIRLRRAHFQDGGPLGEHAPGVRVTHIYGVDPEIFLPGELVPIQPREFFGCFQPTGQPIGASVPPARPDDHDDNPGAGAIKIPATPVHGSPTPTAVLGSVAMARPPTPRPTTTHDPVTTPIPLPPPPPDFTCRTAPAQPKTESPPPLLCKPDPDSPPSPATPETFDQTLQKIASYTSAYLPRNVIESPIPQPTWSSLLGLTSGDGSDSEGTDNSTNTPLEPMEMETDSDSTDSYIQVKPRPRLRVPQRRESTDPSPLNSPTTPSPNVSPCSTPEPTQTAANDNAPNVHKWRYNLRPRATRSSRGTPRRSHPGSAPASEQRSRPRTILDNRPDLALQALEQTGLFHLLDIPVRLWTRSERHFLKTVMRSMRRATQGGVGHGEPANAHDGALDSYPMTLDDAHL
ncbi:hypothetical protein C8Q78DRAFT_1081215 [Trametes maxima]|nr:hypothetical protein C8Q78DRAFT_1081215 [Trametes maxima]